MTAPLVSILIPVYNRADIVSETVQSALAQTYANIEVVIVDNCSTDTSWDVITRLAAGDARIRAFRNDSNVGPVGNWGKCFEHARGQYGKILFSDDLLLPHAVTRYMAAMTPQCAFVVSAAMIGPSLERARLAYRWQEADGTYPAQRFIDQALLGDATPLSPCAALFRLADLRQHLHGRLPGTALDFSMHGAGPDVLLYLLTAAAYPHVAFVAEALVFFRAHEGSLSVAPATSTKVTQAYCKTKVWFANHYQHLVDFDQVVVRAWLTYASVDPGRPSFQAFYSELDPVYRGTIARAHALRLVWAVRSRVGAAKRAVLRRQAA
jgi:glycosyltransferase involved in cell wall biosynthesis